MSDATAPAMRSAIRPAMRSPLDWARGSVGGGGPPAPAPRLDFSLAGNSQYLMLGQRTLGLGVN